MWHRREIPVEFLDSAIRRDFPAPEWTGEPDVASQKRLLARFERLIGVREVVTKALEEARAGKRIGGSLEASVSISGPAETLDFLRSFGDGLRFLFITSGVKFGDAADAISVTVLPAEGQKCHRCWNYTNDVGADPEWPGACARCASAVRLILAETSS